jgi:hypothetical protein
MPYTFLTIAAAFLVIVYIRRGTPPSVHLRQTDLDGRLARITWNAPRLFFALARRFLDFDFIFENAASRPSPSSC